MVVHMITHMIFCFKACLQLEKKQRMKKFDFLISKVHNGILNQTVQTIVVNIKPHLSFFPPPFQPSSTSRKEKEEVAETFLFLTSYRARGKVHKKKKVENLLEEKLFFERRIWTLKGWKEYCSIDDSLRNTEQTSYLACTQGHSYVVLLLCTFIYK